MVRKEIFSKQIQEKQKLLLIGGFDSLGVPYTRDNFDNKSFLDFFDDYLKEKGWTADKVSLFAMGKYNTCDYIAELIGHNYSLSRLRANQIESIDLCRRVGFWQFWQLAAKTAQLYPAWDENDQRCFIDLIRAKKIIFIYSCGSNDLLKEAQVHLGELMNGKKLAEKVREVRPKIDLVMGKIRENLCQLKALNPQMLIFVLGLYTPAPIKSVRVTIQPAIDDFNYNLAKLCKEIDGVYFVDNQNLEPKDMAKMDWHPSREGQKVLGDNIIRAWEKSTKFGV